MPDTDALEYCSVLTRTVVIKKPEGPVAGEIRGVKVDLKNQHVVSLLVSEKGQLCWEVPPEKMHEWDPQDHAPVQKECAQSLTRGDGRMLFGRNNMLVGARVVRPDSQHCGRVRTFWFDKKGAILFYEISRGVLRDLLSGRTKIPPSDIAVVRPNEVVLQH